MRMVICLQIPKIFFSGPYKCHTVYLNEQVELFHLQECLHKARFALVIILAGFCVLRAYSFSPEI
jgi:hypothetical protein